MVCQYCETCLKLDEEDYLCLYADRDCFDGCGECIETDECKYETDDGEWF